MNLSQPCNTTWTSWLLAFSAPLAYGGICCSLWMTALGKDLMGWLQPAWGSIWGWTQLHTALCWSCITQHVDQGFGPRGAVFHGHCTRHHPQSSQLPGRSKSFSRASSSGNCWVHSTGKCLASRYQLLKQASLQREHRYNHIPWI